jgi:hypothetical protein
VFCSLRLIIAACKIAGQTDPGYKSVFRREVFVVALSIEITAYINQLSIQLHRWQLRLQTLNERRKELENELRAAG